ncbi:MAG: ATP-binding protein [Candidatus Micrarchaeota archaeon]|nr:ATP-binding protein [Candidatus Micrarchaeota archaeon]MDE1847507.1 ATP-binding protein [Candidatus Micrarchaeota archaeon]MDE1863857.1 ATP-binding protein [Candidatus Micrarchaeota archaeon]
MADSIAQILRRQMSEFQLIYSSDGIIKRDNQATLSKNIDNALVKVIVGVRRSGKSTLATLLLEGRTFAYANFDEKGLTGINLDELLSFLKEVYGNAKIIFLDEIQNVDRWELWVNSIKRLGYDLIITGSNANMLSKELATHLTGRYVQFEVFPFSFAEYLRLNRLDAAKLRDEGREGELKNALERYMKSGGFPELVAKNLDQSYLKTIAGDIIYKDIVLRWNVRHMSELDSVASYLASICSSEFTATKLAHSLNMKSAITAQKYCNYLHEAYLFFYLKRFSFKAKIREKAPRKVYSIDTGIISAIGTKFAPDSGRLIENLVFLQLRRMNMVENQNLFYYKDVAGKEVDFVIKEGLAVTQLIQTTYASSREEVQKREIAALLKAAKELKCDKLTIITWDYSATEKIEGHTIQFVALWGWLIQNDFAQKRLA